ncbi:hypothetical protein QBC39DRAFT_337122 [Podospora conica]|nr:hypothetical protein QBC39DRAFT_337122 [Schizothecium conicum]
MAQESRNGRRDDRNGRRPSRDYNDRDRRDNRDRRDQRDYPPPPPRQDSYRAPNANLPPRPPPPSNGDGYRRPSYGGNDSYSQDSRFVDFRRDNRERDNRDNRDYRPNAGPDSYRPPQSDFTFRAEKPSGVQDFPANDYRGNNQRPNERRERLPRRGGRGGARGRGGRGGWRPFIPSERELLSGNHAAEPEHDLSKNDVKYRALEDLSDSDEAEMDISGDEGDGSAEEPLRKRTRMMLDTSAAANSVPKWSNPDPYTAIPPESAAQAKKKDVVAMIRKARVTTKEEVVASVPTEAADFISCDFDSTEEEESEPEEEQEVIAQAPPGGNRATVDLSTRDPYTSALGSRKRTHDDVIKAPMVKLGRPAGPERNCDVLREWCEKSSEDPTPWLKMTHESSVKPAVRLHKEIKDFYDFVCPRDFEQRVRDELVADLKNWCRSMFRDADVYPFGSYPTGLYLPTSDMDLVVVSDGVMSGRGLPKYNVKKFLWRFANSLEQRGKIRDGLKEIISKAKVPLVKFVHKETSLKVDISFENTGGLTAVNTFNAWKEQYPAMPILATMIKHLLCMRGLNEPASGGIGGFSVICLVISMLQQMPQIQARSMDSGHHLGELLLNFLDLYGNKFNYRTTAISVNPPEYIAKNRVPNITYRNPDRLAIIDPNDPGNDISGGSQLFPLIQNLFREAHDKLQAEMKAVASDRTRTKSPSYSMLRPLFGGDYSSFRVQRRWLKEIDLKQGKRPSHRRGK